MKEIDHVLASVSDLDHSVSQTLSDAEEVLLTVKEYADLHRLHVQTVYSAVRYGRKLAGRVVRSSSHTIRIAVSRESIKTLKIA